MPKYDSNNADSIRSVFSNDEESLRRAGFRLPSDVKVYADDAQPRPKAAVLGMSDMAIEAAAAWERTGSDELF